MRWLTFRFSLSIFLLATLFATVFSARTAYAQAPPFGRAIKFGGAGSDPLTVVRVDRRNNKYVAGDFSGTSTFGTTTFTSAGGTDGFVVKYRSDGSFGWAVQIGGGGYDQALDMGFDGNENVFVSGTFTDGAIFGSIHGTSKTVSGSGNNIFLAKYDPSGTLLWVQTGLSGGGNNEGFGIAVNPASGVVYITGRAQGDLTFSSSNGHTNVVGGPGNWHVYLVKYDSPGNFQWGEVNSSGINSFATAVAFDSADNAYVVGWFQGNVTFNSRDGHSLSATAFSDPDGPAFPDDGFIVKYDSHGDLKWLNHIGGYRCIANDVRVAPDGNISTAGFIGNINFGDTAALETLLTSAPPGSTMSLGGGTYTNPYNPDIFVATYDPSGVLLGATRIGGAKNDVAGGIAFDDAGNMYLSGMFGGTVDFGGTTLTGPKQSNLFVAKFTGSTLDWAKMATGAAIQGNFEGEPRLAVNRATGKVFVAGTFSGTAIFGGTTLTTPDDVQQVFATSIAGSE
jgi:hypothetical protein